MKKSITIPKIEEDLYNGIKSKADENNQSVSDYVSGLFENALNSDDAKTVIDNQSNEIITLIEEKEKLEENLKSLKTQLEKKEKALEEKTNKITSLTSDCGKFNEQREELKKQIAELTTQLETNSLTSMPNSATVSFEDFDFAVLRYCLENFNKETGKNFNEAELLKYMFNEYAVKGSIYFFKTPGYFRLKEIQKQVEEQKKNHNNE